MTIPPARSACTTLLLSVAARPCPAKPSTPSRPKNAASTAMVRLDRISIIRLLQSDDWEMPDLSGPSWRFAGSSPLLRLVSKTARGSLLFPESVSGRCARLRAPAWDVPLQPQGPWTRVHCREARSGEKELRVHGPRPNPQAPMRRVHDKNETRL